jgi:hypothetical protein
MLFGLIPARTPGAVRSASYWVHDEEEIIDLTVEPSLFKQLIGFRSEHKSFYILRSADFGQNANVWMRGFGRVATSAELDQIEQGLELVLRREAKLWPHAQLATL